MPNQLMLNTRHSNVNFLKFSSIDNSETEGHIYIVIMGEFSLVKISVYYRLEESSFFLKNKTKTNAARGL